jgi:hypothetical protein
VVKKRLLSVVSVGGIVHTGKGSPMKILVCGGRNYTDLAAVRLTLQELHTKKPISLVVHGAARGADSLAGQVAKEIGIPVKEYPARWDIYGRGAGPVRNLEMYQKEKPDLVVAFPGGSGTAHMVKLATNGGTEVFYPAVVTDVFGHQRLVNSPLIEPMRNMPKGFFNG